MIPGYLDALEGVTISDVGPSSRVLIWAFRNIASGRGCDARLAMGLSSVAAPGSALECAQAVRGWLAEVGTPERVTTLANAERDGARYVAAEDLRTHLRPELEAPPQHGGREGGQRRRNRPAAVAAPIRTLGRKRVHNSSSTPAVTVFAS